jgi:hypothetical protein
MQQTTRSRQRAADDVHTTTRSRRRAADNNAQDNAQQQPHTDWFCQPMAATCARKAGRHRDRTSSSFLAAAGTCAIPCPNTCTYTRVCATADNMQQTPCSRYCDSAQRAADNMQRTACSGQRAIDDMQQATRSRLRACNRHHAADNVQPTTCCSRRICRWRRGRWQRHACCGNAVRHAERTSAFCLAAASCAIPTTR